MIDKAKNNLKDKIYPNDSWVGRVGGIKCMKINHIDNLIPDNSVILFIKIRLVRNWKYEFHEHNVYLEYIPRISIDLNKQTNKQTNKKKHTKANIPGIILGCAIASLTLIKFIQRKTVMTIHQTPSLIATFTILEGTSRKLIHKWEVVFLSLAENLLW